MRKIFVSWLIGVALISAQAARAEVEEGAARETPWSGYWWPVSKGELIAGPLTKYDQLTAKAAAQWEYQHNTPGPGVPQWHGYCHAWSASAIMEKEPKKAHSATGPASGQPAMLGVGDQKGMYAAAHAQDVANTYGDRFGDGQGSEDPNDIAPDQLWQILKTYVKQQGLAIVMDLEAGPEVWNYPVYAYRIDYSPIGGSGEYAAQLSLWAADDSVPPDYVGTKVLYHTYTFTVRIAGGSIVMGSGRWTGNSVKNHPDFCWYPYVVRPQNPQVEYALVKDLVGTGSNTTPDNPPGTNPDNPPGTTPDNPPGTTPGTTPGTPPGTTPGTTPGTPPGGIDPSGGQGIQGAIPMSPIQLVAAIAQKTSSFDFDITVDRFDGGHYGVGENFTIQGVSARAGYLYLFYFNSVGDLWLIYPQAGQNNFIQANQRFEIPGPNDAFVFQTAEPVGTARVKGIVTSRPLVLSGLTMQDQSTMQKGLRRVSRRQFRWFPSQQEQVKETLVQYQQQQRQLTPPQLDNVDPLKLLGPFAQDEVAFYVGAPGGKTPGPGKGKQK